MILKGAEEDGLLLSTQKNKTPSAVYLHTSMRETQSLSTQKTRILQSVFLPLDGANLFTLRILLKRICNQWKKCVILSNYKLNTNISERNLTLGKLRK